MRVHRVFTCQERTSRFVLDRVTPSPEADLVNAGESSMTYIGRKWDEAVGGWDVVMLTVSKGLRSIAANRQGGKRHLVYSRLQVHPCKLYIIYFVNSSGDPHHPSRRQGAKAQGKRKRETKSCSLSQGKASIPYFFLRGGVGGVWWWCVWGGRGPQEKVLGSQWCRWEELSAQPGEERMWLCSEAWRGRDNV